MINCFEKYFDAYFAYFAAESSQFYKTRVQFENLMFVIMSTMENTRLRASLNNFGRGSPKDHLYQIILKSDQ